MGKVYKARAGFKLDLTKIKKTVMKEMKEQGMIPPQPPVNNEKKK